MRREKMGKRSIPQSRLRLAWLDSALIVAKLLGADGNRRGGASIKTLTLRDDVRLKRPTHALVCETLKHVPITRLALERAGVALAPDFNPRSDGVGARGAEAPHGAAAADDGFYARLRAPEADGDAVPRSLAFVLAYELLFGAGIEEEESRSPAGGKRGGVGGKGRGRGQPAEELAMLRAAKAIRRSTRSILSESGARDAEGYLLAQPGGRALAAVPTHSRHVRVNTLKLSVDDATRRLARHRPRRDAHVSNLLVFDPGTDLHDHPMVRSGEIVLQGKASCLPAAALGPKRGWDVVDCCAAPGNKTTHLAALVGDGGRVRAFDADGKRLKRLARNVSTAGAGSIVDAKRADFLEVDPLDPEYAGVRAVLLDPSCSGSGTAGTRGDYLIAAARGETVEGTVEGGAEGDAEGGADGVRKDDPTRGHHLRPDKRVDALAQFQLRALLHAFEFPAAERLSYSTCSVHEAENEAVVRAALPRAAELGWRLCAAMPEWPRRGLEGAVEGAECLIRADQFEDDMEGFFVAVFVRDERSIGKEARAARDAAERSRSDAAEERDKEREAKRARERGEEGVRAVLKKSKKKGGRPSALFR